MTNKGKKISKAVFGLWICRRGHVGQKDVKKLKLREYNGWIDFLDKYTINQITNLDKDTIKMIKNK